MKTKDVQVGKRYMTKVGVELKAVTVVREFKDSNGRTQFDVRNGDTGRGALACLGGKKNPSRRGAVVLFGGL